MRRAWVINSYHCPATLPRLLQGLRSAYARDRVVVINDGDDERDKEYRRIANQFDVDYYNDGERLKVWPHGGRWLLRSFRVMSDIDADLYIKLDDDVIVNAPVEWAADVHVQGMLIGRRTTLPMCGAIVALNRDALQIIMRGHDLLSPKYQRTMLCYPTDSVRHTDAPLHWVDGILNREIMRLRLSFRPLTDAALASERRDAAMVVDDLWVCDVCRRLGITNYERAMRFALRASG